LRAGGSARLRRSWSAATATQLVAHGEWFRAHGSGADFVPDRNEGGLALRLEHDPPSGAGWEGSYGATLRAFPDTGVRNHVEHRVEAGWRRDFVGGHHLEWSAEFIRRNTLQAAPTSQDRFWNGELEAAGEWSFGGDWRAALRARGERLSYDASDT